MTKPLHPNRPKYQPRERPESDADRVERQLRSARCCRTPDRTWKTDEQANGSWANVVRAYEEGQCS